MKVSDAERLGFIQKDSAGRYIEPAVSRYDQAQARRQAEHIQQVQAEAQHRDFVLDGDMGQEIDGLQSALRGVGASPITTVMQLLNNPDKVPAALLELGHQSGYTEDAMAQYTAELRAAVEDKLASFAASQGLDDHHMQAWWSWANSGHNQQHTRSAVAQAVVTGDSRQLKDSIRRYVSYVRREYELSGGNR